MFPKQTVLKVTKIKEQETIIWERVPALFP